MRVGVVLADVHAVRGARDRQLGPVVDDEQRVVGVAQAPEDAPGAHDLALVAVLLAQLHDVDARLQRRAQQLLRLAAARPRLADQVEPRAARSQSRRRWPRTAASCLGTFAGSLASNDTSLWNSARPSIAVEARACSRRGMRPASYASRPDSTAPRIARAIFTGSCARAIALAISTPSQPSSIAIAASEAVPTPASQITGHAGLLDDDRSGCTGCGCPCRCRSERRAASPPRSPTSSSRRARIGSSFV